MEMDKILKTAFSVNAMWRTDSGVVFLSQTRKQFTDFEHSGWPSTGHRDENMEKVCRIITEHWWKELPLWKSLTG